MAKIFVSLGTNINRDQNLVNGLNALNETFGSLTLSSLFESEAVGFEGANFFNMVIGFESDLSLAQVFELLRAIEYRYGREPNAQKFSSRTLDLDILLFDDCITSTPVELPRAEILTNAFVLWPLAEIAAEVIHPTHRQSIHALWQNFNNNKQQLRKVPLGWREPQSKEVI